MATLLSISMLSLVPASVAAPIWRTLQLVRSHRFFVLSTIISAISTLVFGGFFVGFLGIGVYGIAVVTVLNSWIGLGIAYFAVMRLGFMLNEHDWYIIVVVLIASIFFSWLGVEFSKFLEQEGLWLIITNGVVYSTLVTFLFWTLRVYIKRILVR